LLAKLEEKGMIVRTKSEEDKRKAIISITELGKEKVANCGCKNRAERLYAGLSEEEKENLKTLLEKLMNSWNCQE
uniref:MarR family winged helix-turn-helix transcriptional regulator n=1 Tax=uncultured Fusobacterium sp. TaxID=159267 RepID=UPI003459A6A2